MHFRGTQQPRPLQRPPVNREPDKLSISDVVLFVLLAVCVFSAVKYIANTPVEVMWQNMVESGRAVNFADQTVTISVTDGPPPIIHDLIPTHVPPTNPPAEPQVVVVTATFTPTPIPTATSTPTPRPTTDAQRGACSQHVGACSSQDSQRSGGG